MERDAALLIVDVQNDFCPGGALQIVDGDQVLGPINRAARRFAEAGLPVLATRDWHPPVTKHFKDFGGPWPVHCVRETRGAAFHPDLRLPPGSQVLSKGVDPEQDGYSAFDGVDDAGREPKAVLSDLGVHHLYIAGLATDYCVLFTGREALENGFEVTVLTDAVAGVDAVPGASQAALQELAGAGAHLTEAENLY